MCEWNHLTQINHFINQITQDKKARHYIFGIKMLSSQKSCSAWDSLNEESQIWAERTLNVNVKDSNFDLMLSIYMKAWKQSFIFSNSCVLIHTMSRLITWIWWFLFFSRCNIFSFCFKLKVNSNNEMQTVELYLQLLLSNF